MTIYLKCILTAAKIELIMSSLKVNAKILIVEVSGIQKNINNLHAFALQFEN